MVCDVATKGGIVLLNFWSTTPVMQGAESVVISEQRQRPRSACLKHFQLTKHEWELLKKLFPLLEYAVLWSGHLQFSDVYLQVFLIATRQISQSKTPLIHEVIPIFNIITWALDEHAEDLHCRLLSIWQLFVGMLCSINTTAHRWFHNIPDPECVCFSFK